MNISRIIFVLDKKGKKINKKNIIKYKIGISKKIKESNYQFTTFQEF